MGLSPESKKHVDKVATESLGMLTDVAIRAKSELNSGGFGSGALASVNTLTSAQAIQNVGSINHAIFESAQVLAREPAIARIVVLCEDGNERVYYICRATPVSGFNNLASYKASIGKLAAQPIGSTISLPNGQTVEVIERTRLRPTEVAGNWDSHGTVFEWDSGVPITIESLRVLLLQIVEPEKLEDFLAQLLAEEGDAANISEGIRRSLITKMSLRDQPILDQYQDEIFRLPLDQRLLLLGPPGTGKTTTLIRRLGQKLDVAYLLEEETRIVASVSQGGSEAHSDSWLMFTPTELLKQFLKEAFAREGVPASDQRLKTWDNYRRELGRNVLGILRTAGSTGSFTLKESASTLLDDATLDLTGWFSEFDTWQCNAYIQDLRQAALTMVAAESPELVQLGGRIVGILEKANRSNLPSVFLELAGELAKVQALVTTFKDLSDKKIGNAFNLAYNRDRGFVDDLAKFLEQLRTSTNVEADVDDADDADDQDGDEEDLATPKVGKSAAIAAYMRAVRSQARAQAAKRSIGKTTRNGKIIEWIGDRSLAVDDRPGVGAQLLMLVALRRFVNPVKRYLVDISKRYRAFRREPQSRKKWYSASNFLITDLHPLELDVLILASLRGAGELMSRPNIARRVVEPYWSALQTVQGLYKHQILVDEATDFSPIQLACMAALAHPQLKSFFACGDFNQRLTTWGSRTLLDMQWVFPDIEIREVSVAYRQSRQLNELAKAIISVLGVAEQHVSLPQNVDSEGRSPALLENSTEKRNVVAWLAERVREVERSLGQLPSTAVFVNSEDEVQSLADLLSAELEDSNIRVVACPKGQVMGQDNDIRVFDIQHIKGLEFEAVFFVGIDRLAGNQPALFDKFLYVGTTRAATYLGLTCEASLPSTMEELRPHFTTDWSGT